MNSLPLLVLIVLALVVFFVLPARQRKAAAAKQQTLRDSLAPGTPIMLTSGLHATVVGVGDGTVTVEVAPGVVTKWAQQAVLEVRKPALDTTAPDAGTPHAGQPKSIAPDSTVPRDGDDPAHPAR